MKDIVIYDEIHSDIGPRGEDYGVPYLRIDPDVLKKNGYKVGDKVKITITKSSMRGASIEESEK